MKKLSTWKITAIVLVSLIAFVILFLLGYVLYVVCQYSRIPDNELIATDSKTAGIETLVSADGEYSVSTFNIGFGAYDQAFDFFMDSGQMKPEHGGEAIYGTHGKAVSRENVLKNTNGAIDALKKERLGKELDFMFYQEVDTKADRSYHVNQYEMIRDYYNNAYRMESVFVCNYHSAYLHYPLHDPHGKSEAGIVTLSKYKMDSTLRRSYPLDTGFAKFFDLDRCFAISRLPIANSTKQLVLINSHMSAYDEGGVIRAAQLKMLNDVLETEKASGNYVVVGGDFNHDIANSKNLYPSWEVVPDASVDGWLYQLFDGVNVKKEDDPTYSDIASGYRFAVDRNPNVPTCRCCEMPYERDENGVVKNYRAVLDGFIVSDNVEIVSVKNIDEDFMYSDHNPVVLTFKLK